jgi:LacI family transcriptional regulator
LTVRSEFSNVPKRFGETPVSSLRALAEKLGLSITTVSRALDGYDDVALATRKRVVEAARELNYQPNAAARSLRKQRAETVAVVLPTDPGRIGPQHFLDMLFEAAKTLGDSGLDLMLLPAVGRGDELDTYRRMVDGRRADAAIIVRTRVDDERVTFLHERGIPFVTHGRTNGKIVHAFVDGDGQQGFHDATRVLLDLGHRQIAHIAAPSIYTFARERRAGWYAALSDAGLSEEALEASAEPNETGGYAAADQLLRSGRRPTALLCATDTMAIGAMRRIKDMGLVPGREIAVIGHDNLLAGAYTDPPLSTMEIAAPDMGRMIAEKLIALLGGAKPEDLQDILPVRQVPRATHAPVPPMAG